jgi:hypothetical protein
VRRRQGQALVPQRGEHAEGLEQLDLALLLGLHDRIGTGIARIRSEARGSTRRCSKGKSNSVASIWLVSSTATLSTKSKVSPRGSSSRIFAARSRIRGSSTARLGGANIGAITLRCWSWSGGSRAMKLDWVRGWKPSKMVIPPSSESDGEHAVVEVRPR